MKEDQAIAVLDAVGKKIAPDMPGKLIKKCYEIEKQFLFEKDRQKPMETIRQLIEDFVSDEPNENRG